MTSFGGNEGDWIWTWQKDVINVGGAWIQLGLKDVGGPTGNTDSWDLVRSLVHTLAREIYWLDVVRSATVIELLGSVASERVKAILDDAFGRMTSTLRNELEVAAAFESATDDDEDPLEEETEGSGHVASVTRFPSITPLCEARAGQVFRFDVDLGKTPDLNTDARPVEITDLPKGWSTVHIGVDVYCSEIIFDPPDGDVG